MRAFITVLITAMLVCLTAAPALAKQKNYVEGELLVKFKGSAGKPKRDNAHAKAGSQRLKHFEFIDVEHIRLKPGMSVEDAIALYSSDPDVEYAEPNHLRFAFRTTPNDYSSVLQWGPDKVQAPEMWDIVTNAVSGDPSFVIAVVDSGVNYNHPDLAANIWQNPNPAECSLTNSTNNIDDDGNSYIDDCDGWDFVENDNMPLDGINHGTKVAGIIGAAGNNGIGIAGMLWDVKLMPLRFIDSDGVGSVALEIAAINYAMGKGVKVINASFGGAGSAAAEYDAINAFCGSGGIIVASAGNAGIGETELNMDLLDSMSRIYPAAYGLPCIISVASSSQTDELSPTSYYGHISVDLAAPGEGIYSTSSTGGYATDSGTSFAAPHVTGIVSLLWAARPTMGRDEVIKRVITAAEWNTSLNGNVVSGGRANAYNTLLPLPEAETGNSCFIATAAYGNPDAPEVRRLREFRDNVLMQSAQGRYFVSLYYRLSPPLAGFLSRHETARAIVRASLYPLNAAIGHPVLFGFWALGLCSTGAFVVTYTIRARSRRRK